MAATTGKPIARRVRVDEGGSAEDGLFINRPGDGGWARWEATYVRNSDHMLPGSTQEALAWLAARCSSLLDCQKALTANASLANKACKLQRVFFA